jgi:anti-sigma factor RsiW
MSDTWTDRLSEYVDDDLTPDERRALDAHLVDCGDCRMTLAELRSVVARAAAVTPRPPERDLWDGVASQIGVKPSLDTLAARRAAWRISFTLPQLVAAGLALMVLSGGAVWVGQHGGRATALPELSAANGSGEAGVHRVPIVMPDPHYDEAVADLEQTLQRGRASLDPQTIAVIDRNVQAIDRAIEESRQALAQDPANIYLNNHLAEAKQQKLSLLRQAAAIATKNGS